MIDSINFNHYRVVVERRVSPHTCVVTQVYLAMLPLVKRREVGSTQSLGACSNTKQKTVSLTI